MKLDNNIYGHDETGCASKASRAALNASGDPLVKGLAIDQEAQSESAEDTLRLAEVATVKILNVGGGSDKRAVTKGNHGSQG